jgi:hypothetical protein
MPNPLIWYYADGGRAVLARLLSLGAHASMVEYTEDGMKWQVLVDNDDIEFIKGQPIDDED